MHDATLTIISRNFGSWSLRGWLLCRFAGLEVEVRKLPKRGASARAELLFTSPSYLAPRLEHGDVAVWEAPAIGEYLHELRPQARLLPAGVAARAHCRSVSSEMHAGFANLRAALPMDLRAHHPGFRVYPGAQADIDRIQTIWADCLERYGGPLLFGATPTLADAMYAPVCARFATYDVPLEERCAAYCDAILALPDMVAWTAAAMQETEERTELEVEF